MRIVVIVIALILGFSACKEPVTLPKKHGFPRMELPQEPVYILYESKTCPFVFEAPEGGEITRDLADSCWMDIKYSDYNLTWHVSHRDTRRTGLTADIHFEEHRKLVYKHSQKATEIRPADFIVPAGRATVHELYGEVGTPYYLFLRDSSNTQVAQVSFYFQTALENDSLAPMIDYMKRQMDHAARTFRWKW